MYGNGIVARNFTGRGAEAQGSKRAPAYPSTVSVIPNLYIPGRRGPNPVMGRGTGLPSPPGFAKGGFRLLTAASDKRDRTQDVQPRQLPELMSHQQ
jgi:hypothetical protein